MILIDRIKLRKAFALMRADGLVARMNFACCQTCGIAELSDVTRFPRPLGYAFYHKQDAEALPGGPLYIAFGSLNKGGDQGRAALEAGNIVRDCLVRAGFEPTWDGTTAHRIVIGGFNKSDMTDEHRVRLV